MINYYLENGIMLAEFSGVVTFEEIMDHISIKEERNHFPKKLKILSNASNAKLSIKPNQLPIIKSRMAETLNNYDQIFDAFLVSKPLETAITTLYMELAKLKKYEFKVFSTYEAAENWLKHK